MSRTPFRSPHQNHSVSPSPARVKRDNPPSGTLRPKGADNSLPRVVQPSREPAAPRLNRPAHGAPQAVQPKTPNAAPILRGRFNTGAATGVVQANLIGGTRALQARLCAQHAALHQRNNAARPNNAQTVQRKSSAGVDAFKVSLQPKTGGQPLPGDVRAKMETAFGMDFSDVRVHVGQEASSIGALAYTWGTDIHFAPGQYNPHTTHGQKILGHELWHVVQQKSGRVSNPFGGGVAVVQDHALEAEADRMGVKAAMTAVVYRPGDER
jgi:hypothetical protein